MSVKAYPNKASPVKHHNVLRDLGARDARIFAEAFGPAALKRRADAGITAFEPEPEADTAVVKFAQSGHEQHWEKATLRCWKQPKHVGSHPHFLVVADLAGAALPKNCPAMLPTARQ